MLANGIHNSWVQDSMDKLAVLMPGRYAKNEMSTGFVGSIVAYAYRMPIAPAIDVEALGELGMPQPGGVAVSLDDGSLE